MWATPKTNWQATDYFTLNADYSRIKGNLLYIQTMARSLYPNIALLNMADYSIDSLPYLEFFANIERNLEKLYDGTFRRQNYSVREMQENGSVWDHRDLNRIEGMLEQMYSDLLTQQATRQVMSFVMGGGAFAALV